MTCGGCAKSVTKAIVRLDPVAEVVADPPNRWVDIRTDAELTAVLATLDEAGFPATSV